MNSRLHVGLVVNPLAGLGGSLALKGSDGEDVRALAETLPPESRHRAQQRTERALAVLQKHAQILRFTTWAGDMGEASLRKAGLSATVLGQPAAGVTSAEDTRQAVAKLLESRVDVILFAGGDGTARDICDVVGQSCPVLGIPAGVKMHSGVFAVSPEAAGELVAHMALGGLVAIQAREVRDIDEEAFRQDSVRSRYYGDLKVPSEGHFLQHTKVGGREDPQLAAADIAAWEVANMEAGRLYLIGPGSTTAAIMEELGVPNTLLGVDVVKDGKLLAADANERELLALLAAADEPATIVVTVIGGQGYVFGRGNQQLSAAVIKAVGTDHIVIVAAKSKLTELQGRPLLVDTNDVELDRSLCGFHTVVTGYDDRVLYRITDG